MEKKRAKFLTSPSFGTPSITDVLRRRPSADAVKEQNMTSDDRYRYQQTDHRLFYHLCYDCFFAIISLL